MPPRSNSPICERSLDLTLIEIGRRDIPQCSPKHFFMKAFYRTFSGGQRPRLRTNTSSFLDSDKVMLFLRTLPPRITPSGIVVRVVFVHGCSRNASHNHTSVKS